MHICIYAYMQYYSINQSITLFSNISLFVGFLTWFVGMLWDPHVFKKQIKLSQNDKISPNLTGIPRGNSGKSPIG